MVDVLKIRHNIHKVKVDALPPFIFCVKNLQSCIEEAEQLVDFLGYFK